MPPIEKEKLKALEQALQQIEYAGIRNALGECAAEIEVPECRHMSGDLGVIGVRADFAENAFKRRPDDGELHGGNRIARVT